MRVTRVGDFRQVHYFLQFQVYIAGAGAYSQWMQGTHMLAVGFYCPLGSVLLPGLETQWHVEFPSLPLNMGQEIWCRG